MFGGPVYFYQNVVYNAPTGSLKYIEGSSGILTYNNTIIGEGRAGPASNQHFRNNLILAQGAFDPVFAVTTYTNYSSSDYNGYRPNPNVSDSFEWNSPTAITLICAPSGKPPDRNSIAFWSITISLREYRSPIQPILNTCTCPRGSISAYGPAPQLLMPALRCRR
jgi:hypothetical protein